MRRDTLWPPRRGEGEGGDEALKRLAINRDWERALSMHVVSPLRECKLEGEYLLKGEALFGRGRVARLPRRVHVEECRGERGELVAGQDVRRDRVLDGLVSVRGEYALHCVQEPERRDALALWINRIQRLTCIIGACGKERVMRLFGIEGRALNARVGDVGLLRGAGDHAGYLYHLAIGQGLRNIGLIEPHKLDTARSILERGLGHGPTTLPAFPHIRLPDGAVERHFGAGCGRGNRRRGPRLLIAGGEVIQKVAYRPYPQFPERLLLLRS